jgi:hypothetical protein
MVTLGVQEPPYEPFDAVELELGALWLEEPPSPPPTTER